MKIVMFGSGAAGSVFASYLKLGGADMILVDRYQAHMDAVRENGMEFTIHNQVNGEFIDDNHLLKGFRTYTSAQDAVNAEGIADIIIYMCKATQLPNAIQDSLPLVGENTVAVSLINGLGNDDNLMKVYPAERCVIGSGVLGTSLPHPGACISTPADVIHMNFGGIKRSELSDAACQHLLDCFRNGNCNAFWRADDIYDYIWRKVILNATVNCVSAVLRMQCGPIEDDPNGAIIYREIITESINVANAKGAHIDLDEYIQVNHVEFIKNIYDYYPSMAQDMLFNQRQTEIDVLNGKIAEYGEQLGIPTPANMVISQIVRCIQNNYDKQYFPKA